MRRIRKPTALLFALLVVCSGSAAETMYVTDKLILGVYDNSEGSGQQISVVRSGAKLDIMERVGRYARIATESGEEGWVKSQYLVSEPPAILLVEELEAQLRVLNDATSEDPETLQARNLELENRVAEQAGQLQVAQQRSSALQQELDLARDAVAVAQAHAAAAEDRAEQAERQPPPPAPSPHPVAAPIDKIGERLNFFAQLSLVGLALVLLGMFLGYKVLDLYIRRQHGGYRVW